MASDAAAIAPPNTPEWKQWVLDVQTRRAAHGEAAMRVTARHRFLAPMIFDLKIDWRPGEERQDVEGRALGSLHAAIQGLSDALATEAVRRLAGLPPD